MEFHINRRIREKAMVFGLPAENFLACFGIMVAPIFLFIFVPLALVGWIPWVWGVYQLFRRQDALLRAFVYNRHYPAHLKNR